MQDVTPCIDAPSPWHRMAESVLDGRPLTADEALQILTSGDERADGMALLRGDPYRRGRRLHRTYIEAQLVEVADMLDRLDVLEASSDGAHGKG